MQLDSHDMYAVVNRAKRAHGHLGKVIAMMEEGSDCEDVLTQLSAVLKALERAGFQIVATGLQQCIAAGDGPDSVDVRRMEKLFLGLA
jgi:DNA-binding FrmR family transcriptional regulator